ncbi:MAG: GAP family protein [Thermomicrobiales bacterium]
MTIALLGTLIGLALIDSTSIGTVGVPVMLTLARVPAPRKLVYLVTITLFYFLVGVLVLLGLASFLDAGGDALQGTTAQVIQLVVGVGLFALSFRFSPKRRKASSERTWLPAQTSTRAMVALGITSGVVELATMVPYIAAIGILTQSSLSSVEQVVTLGGYTVVMAFPALVLIVVAQSAGAGFDRFLQKIEGWITRNGDGMIGWALGIVGLLLAVNAAFALFG